MMQRKTTITIAGNEYEAQVGTISKAVLGFEDHGVFTAYLVFEGVGWGQAEPARAWGGPALKLYITKVLATLNVRDWSQVQGKVAFVLRDPGGIIVGFAHQTEDRAMFFQQVADEAKEAS
jgi:hypothetical protein